VSYNGSGTFTIDTAGNPVVADTEIDPDVHNNTLTEIAAGLSLAICRDGQSTITQNISFNNKLILDVQQASTMTGAATIQNIIGSSGLYISTVGGTANAITLTPFPTLGGVSIGAGLQFYFIAAATNTGAVTVDVSGIGVKNLTKLGTTALSAGDIQAGQIMHMMYDGTRFQLV